MKQAVRAGERQQAGPAVWSRDFTFFFTARSVSMLGAAMIPFATAIGVNDLGYGATGVGLALAAWMAPFAVLILFGGVFADRFTPRRMMIGADLVRTVTQALMAALLIPLGSVLVTESLGTTAYGLVMSASGAGTIVGGLVAMRVRPARPLMAGAVGLFGFALEPLAIATAMPLEVLMAAHVVGGAGWAF
ncbi:hypothetical protein ACFFMN_32035 [Planobispora siamensis]|uniref:Major facilitator superfamily (MFS) profile domain-containing protein n=1 Tax=Planobispora siamensis TaxID=936338 RepID=A0A8J3SAK1_9ACTN|nr:hypothetical protein [Planobispora siamensis]GIH90922.1 hypothetical protein Psi01_15520 [Planobispora siamensis]